MTTRTNTRITAPWRKVCASRSSGGWWALANCKSRGGSLSSQACHRPGLDPHAVRTWHSSWSFPAAVGQIALQPVPLDQPLPPDQHAIKKQIDFLIEHWIKDQTRFFNRRIKSQGDKSSASTTGTNTFSPGYSCLDSGPGPGLVVASWDPGGPPGFCRCSSNPMILTFSERFLACVLMITSLLLLYYALHHEYIAQQGLSEQVKSYHRMKGLFERATDLWRSASLRTSLTWRKTSSGTSLAKRWSKTVTGFCCTVNAL